jgi:osmoprotectant transport system ATP-binding protein
LIRLVDIRHRYSSADGDSGVALDGVTLEVREGETLCLIGRSGSGKTTLMKTINRLVVPASGEVWVCGENVASLDPVRLRRKIGYVIQSGGLFPHFTVADNVGLLCRLEGWEGAKTRARVEELLQLVNLDPSQFGDRYPGELSGGQRQRVGVARALAVDPQIMLMDEPFGALDPITRDQLHEEFLRLKEQVKKTTVLVTHDMAEAFRLGDRVALLDAGKLVQVGEEAEFRERPATPFVESFLSSHLR